MGVGERDRSLDVDGRDLSIGICGPFSLKVGGREYPPIPAGQRAVLTLLALNSNAAIRTDSIIAALWADRDPPATASAMVHTYIYRLRSEFKAAGLATTRHPVMEPVTG
jgi:DNA-binding SARP family transcriptional activator